MNLTQQYGNNRQSCQQNKFYYVVWELLLYYYREFPLKILSVCNQLGRLKFATARAVTDMIQEIEIVIKCFRCPQNFNAIGRIIPEIQKLEFLEVLIRTHIHKPILIFFLNRFFGRFTSF